MRIAMAQINATVGDLNGNQKKIIDYIECAKRYKADIVVFPELALSGYPPEDLLLKRHFVKENIKTLSKIAKAVSGITAVVGYVDEDKNGNLYNAAAVVNNGKSRGVYRKVKLPNYSVFDEKRYFITGNKNYVFRLGGVVFGVTICEDIWTENGPYVEQVESGAQLIINISASPYYAGKLEVRKEMLIKRAKEMKAYLCYTNLVGGQDELVFDGASFLFSPQGEMIACGKQFVEDLIITDLKMNIFSQRKRKTSESRLKKIVLPYSRDGGGRMPLHEHRFKPLNELEEIYNALIVGTKDYVRKNGFKKTVIGLSGGIDSSLTAVIACDALGKENVVGVSMPSQYSSQETQLDAQILAKNLEIDFYFVPIDSVFRVYLMTMEKTFFGLERDVTEENIQARIRGNILMALSNKFGWLVLTTGNKSEIATGYCTLYGDTAGGFAVLKDVPKSLVYELAAYRDKKDNKKIIPKSVFEREPSAELKFNQKDRDVLPPYAILDEILHEYIEEDKCQEEIVSKIKNPEIVKKIIAMVDRNEYKRRQMPPGVKITPKAFGKDRRLPITNRYEG